MKSLPSNYRQSDAMNDGLNDAFADPPPLESLGESLPATKPQESILEEIPAETELNGNGNSILSKRQETNNEGSKSILQTNKPQDSDLNSSSDTQPTEAQSGDLSAGGIGNPSVFEQKAPELNTPLPSESSDVPAQSESVGELPLPSDDPFDSELELDSELDSGDGQTMVTAQGWVLDSGRDASFETGPVVADVTQSTDLPETDLEAANVESGESARTEGQVAEGPVIEPPVSSPSLDSNPGQEVSAASQTELAQNIPMPAEADEALPDPFDDVEPNGFVDDQTQTETNGTPDAPRDADADTQGKDQSETSNNAPIESPTESPNNAPTEEQENPFDDPDDPFADADPVEPVETNKTADDIPATEGADAVANDPSPADNTDDAGSTEDSPSESEEMPFADESDDESADEPFADQPANFETGNQDSDSGNSVGEPNDAGSLERQQPGSDPKNETPETTDPSDSTVPSDDLTDADSMAQDPAEDALESDAGVSTTTDGGAGSAAAGTEASTIQQPLAKPQKTQEGSLLDYWWAALPLLLLPLVWYFIRKKSRISEVELVQAAGGRGWRKADLSKSDSSIEASDESFVLTAGEDDETVESNGSDDSIVGIVNRFRDGDITDSSEMFSDELSDISGLVDLNEPDSEAEQHSPHKSEADLGVAAGAGLASVGLSAAAGSEPADSLDSEDDDSFFGNLEMDDEELESSTSAVAELAHVDSASSSDMDVLSPRVHLSIDQDSNPSAALAESADSALSDSRPSDEAESDSSEFDFSADSEFTRSATEASDAGETGDELAATLSESQDSSEDILMFDEPEEDGFLAEIESTEPKTTESSEMPVDDLSAELTIELNEIDGVRAPGFPEDFSVPADEKDVEDSDMFDMHEDIDILNLDDVSSEDLLADQEIASDGAVLAEAFGDADSENGIPESIFSLTAKPDASDIDLPAFDQIDAAGNGQPKNPAGESGVLAIGNEVSGDPSDSMKASRSSKKRDLLVEIEKLRNENERLNSTLRAATDEKMVIAEQLQNSENKILELSGTLDATNQEKSQFGDRLRANESKFTDLSLALTAANSSKEDLAEEINELKRKLAEADAQIEVESNVEKTLQRVQAEFEHALAEKESLSQKLSDVEAELSQAAEWEARVQELESSFTQAIKDNEALNEKLSQMEKANAEANAHAEVAAGGSNGKPSSSKKKRTTKIDPVTGVVKISRKDEGALKMLEALKKENRKRKQSDLLLAQAEEQRAELFAELRVLREREAELLAASEGQQNADASQPSDDLAVAERKVMDLEIAMEELVADKQEQAKLIDRLKEELDGLKRQVASATDEANAGQA